MEKGVKLIGITQPSKYVQTELGIKTAEELVAYVARVSNPANQNNPEYERLLKYLAKHQHWSPFEMINLVLEINTTRDIARQILRHRSFAFQEFSQRYAEVTEDGFATREARLQDTKNRQNSIETNDEDLALSWMIKQQQLQHEARLAYKWAIEKGIAKEQARVVLPEGMTMSKMYMNGSLRSWIHYCSVRMGNGTQKEHRLIATECWNIITDEIPSLTDVLKE